VPVRLLYLTLIRVFGWLVLARFLPSVLRNPRHSLGLASSFDQAPTPAVL
jgi:hypothetical protein